MESFIRSKFRFAFLFTFFSVNFINAEEREKDDFCSVKNIASAYLKSFGFNEEDEFKLPIHNAKERQKKIDYTTGKPPVMDDITIRKSIYDIFDKAQYVTDYLTNNSGILNKFSWNDLKLFYGTSADIGFNLVSRIKHTTTITGECAMTLILATPTDNINELMNRQDIINTFLQNDSLSERFQHYLDLYKDKEQSFISFWSQTDPIYNKAYKSLFRSKFYFKKKAFNNKTFMLEANKRLMNDCVFFSPLWIALIQSLLSSPQRTFPIFWDNFISSLTPVVNIMPPLMVLDTSRIVVNSLFSIVNLLSIYNSITTFKQNKNILKNIALRMNDVKNFLYVITKIESEIEADPELSRAFNGKIDAIKELISLSKTGKTAFGRFLKTIKGMSLYDMNFFFNNTGKLLACFQIFIDNKDLFNNAIFELGRIDAFISIPKLIKESTRYNDQHTYNFTKFLNKEMSGYTPYIKAKEMWNPFLNSRMAIGNDVEFGDNSPSGLKTMILTGPNAGGKSTFIVGLETCILLSQVFGIAPADEFILTPFSKINSYIEVRDDIASGKSLFVSEVDRIQKHINILDSLEKDKFSFTIFDEPFRGTNPYEGAAVEYSVLEALSKYNNSLTIVATHYPIIMLLEEKKYDKGFRNYKVFISRNPENQDIIYHFKIVPGRATQSIAIDILEKYGYDKELLGRARDIINNPERYSPSL